MLVSNSYLQNEFNINNKNWYFNYKTTDTKRNGNLKKISDVTATTLWLSATGFAIYKTGLFRKKSPENILNKAKRIERKYSKLESISKIQDDINVDKLLTGKNKFQKFIIKTTYNLGKKFQNTKAKMGDELYNNLINSMGKLFIMPLVICTSIIGKNETSKQEKASIIIREPLSVIATFTLQGAFDKLFDVYMPKILESNIFETDEIRRQYKSNGKIALSEFENIKYNQKETKRLFVELTEVECKKGGLKNILSRENAQKLITLDAFEPHTYESYIRNFDKYINKGIIKPEHLDIVKKKFKIVADSIGNYELAKVKPKIAMNILVVVILSRIFLNVIHGKTVKKLNLNENKEAKNG